jgi:N6-adenosine-specific RNA methylase IME4
MVSIMRGKHSAKPEEVRSRIEQMFPDQTKIELFARTTAAGWASHGDEIEADIRL